ncbi:MAG: hypothetical protein QW390_04875, partial [Candidatus Bathyarchaeia archaeon]
QPNVSILVNGNVSDCIGRHSRAIVRRKGHPTSVIAGKAMGAQVTDRVLEERMVIASTPEEHLRKITGLIEMGLSHVYFVSLSPDEEEFIRVYGESVIPVLKEGWGGFKTECSGR